MSDFTAGLQDFGGAVSDLFAAKGATAAADSYTSAATIAEQNALLAKQATAIKETQASRQIFQTVSAGKASIGGAGFAESGSALDILRSSTSQGALAKAMIANQGAITENTYAEQAGMFRGMAGASKTAATGDTIGGVIQGAGGAMNVYNGATKLLGASTAADTSIGIAGATAAGDAVAATALGTGAMEGIGIAGGTAALGDAVAATAVDAAAGASIWESAAAFLACFITTAITKALGKPDDCDELQTLRAFRDGWLKDNHPDDIAEYYRIAPRIVEEINAQPDASETWAVLYVDYLAPAIEAIKSNRNHEAYGIYRQMVAAAEGSV